MQEPTVAIPMKELISLMAKEVAQQVADELREKDINPLRSRLSLVELRMAAPIPDLVNQRSSFDHLKGMFDGMWKLAVIALSLLEAWHYIKH